LCIRPQLSKNWMHVKGNKAKDRFKKSQTFLKHRGIKDSTPAPQIGLPMREV